LTLTLTWGEVALRLALTVAAGILLGYNRSQHGKAAGIRTTVLVCLAASVAMIQVNLLLPTADRPPSSFVMNDLMRLPLGILTGVGFIGAGAILRRENLVVGVTTAATLWLVTVIGLCLGGGQIVLGVVATLLGVFSLWGLMAIENSLRVEHHARLRISVDTHGPGEDEIRQLLAKEGLTISGCRMRLLMSMDHRDFVYEIRYRSRSPQTQMPAALQQLASRGGVISVEWRTLS
jgi:putative Mg2+ transporter-C (MgtC) family protein